MMSKQKIFLIIIAVLFLISLGVNIARLVPETKNYNAYTEGLEEYKNNNYSEAYRLFGKVSRFSKLKPAAIYRQANCADKLGDVKTEINKYKDIIFFYPTSELTLKVKYSKAQIAYENKNYGVAKREFESLSNKYPKTDYAIAAQYYLGSIQAEKAKKIKNKNKSLRVKNIAIKHFKTYLKEAPTGKFAINCVEKWISLNTKLNNEDNLLIAKTYQENQDYRDAKKYLKFTNISVSWPYFVKNAYEMKNYPEAKYYTELGLKADNFDEVLINEDIDEQKENENIYKAIDIYLKISNSQRSALSYLLSISSKAKGHDYLLYKTCNNLPANNKAACYNTLFYKYPNGQFAAESLANIFYDNVKNEQYYNAKRLGRMHLTKFKEVNSTPEVIFWLAKIAQRTKNYEEAKSYYRRLIKQFPDDYYAYHAFLNLNRFRYLNIVNLKEKPVEFPYKNPNYELITELLKVKDYGLINQLYKDDDFIHSWLDYQQGNYSSSARIARDAMDKLPNKPDRQDLRWRLVYPLHYYNEIKRYASIYQNDPTLILAIIREESYFNPQAKSPVGAMGLMQLMPATAHEAARKSGISLLSNNLLFDSETNLKLGNIYYSSLKRGLVNRDMLAVLAYNGGIGSVSRWQTSLNYFDTDDFIEQIPYSETQNYLKKVYRSYWNYLRVYDGIKW